MDPRHASLRLDLDLAGDPVTGRIAQDGAEPRRFVGYASLIASLEAIRADEATGDFDAAAEARTPDV